MDQQISSSTEPSSKANLNSGTTPNATAANEAASKLVESIDDFLGDIEKKFSTISDEILTKLDDMAERCDRLEQDMLLSSSSGVADSQGGNAGSPTGDAAADKEEDRRSD